MLFFTAKKSIFDSGDGTGEIAPVVGNRALVNGLKSGRVSVCFHVGVCAVSQDGQDGEEDKPGPEES